MFCSCDPLNHVVPVCVRLQVGASDGGSSDSSTGAIIGAAVGVPLGVLALVGAVGGFWYLNKRKRDFAAGDGLTAPLAAQDLGRASAGSVAASDVQIRLPSGSSPN